MASGAVKRAKRDQLLACVRPREIDAGRRVGSSIGGGDYGAGHGKGETRSARADMLADTMAFLWHELSRSRRDDAPSSQPVRSSK